MELKNLIRRILPLSETGKYCLSFLKDESDYQVLKNLAKLKKISFESKNLSLSFAEDAEYFQITSKDESLSELVYFTNERLKKKFLQISFKNFSEKAFEIISSKICHNEPIPEGLKNAVALQFFSNNLNILILANRTINRLSILESVSGLYPIFNIATPLEIRKHGLCIVIDGKNVKKGILPSTNKGIVGFDSINLLKKDEKQLLIRTILTKSAQLKKHGFDTDYEADVKLLSTVSPSTGSFAKDLATLKKQIPVDKDLLKLFNVIFIVAKKENTIETIVTNDDKYFIKEYVKFCLNIHPVMPEDLAAILSTFARTLRNEKIKFPIDLPLNILETLKELSKASARLELRDAVENKDINRAMSVFKQSLEF